MVYIAHFSRSIFTIWPNTKYFPKYSARTGAEYLSWISLCLFITALHFLSTMPVDYSARRYSAKYSTE